MQDLFKQLFHSIDYCLLHNWEDISEKVSGDLDIVVHPRDLDTLKKKILVIPNAKLVNFILYESNCYYIALAVRNGDSIHFLIIDVATDYRWDGRVWFKAEELLLGRRNWKGFWVAAPEVEFKYLLTKKILKGDFPQRAAKRLQRLAKNLNKKADLLVEDLLGGHWAKQVIDLIRGGKWKVLEANLSKLKKVLKRRKLLRDPLDFLSYWFSELKRIYFRLRYPTGLWIAVLGPDGAGKSTLIEQLKDGLERPFRRTAVYHFSPGLFRRIHWRAPTSDPHSKPPYSVLVSLLKLVYYWLEFTLGYWLKIRIDLIRSTIVFFDRYYEDLLIDPKRYRYGGPFWWAKWLNHIIPAPDLWLVVDVPEKELMSRKRELSEEEAQRQRKEYKSFALRFSNAFLLNGKCQAVEVARQAQEVILNYLHERCLKRIGLTP